MSQPLNQRESHPALGLLDHEKGEFWMPNPWEAVDENLSAYERNRIAMNVAGRRFVDASFPVSGDYDSDSRAVVMGDFNKDGMPDLLVRNTGGGPLRLLINRFPQTHWLSLDLEGQISNRSAIGARVKVRTGLLEQWRENFPHASFQSQQSRRLEFGLGQYDVVDQVMIEWPSGLRQEFNNVPVDQRIRIVEGQDEWQPVAGSERREEP